MNILKIGIFACLLCGMTMIYADKEPVEEIEIRIKLTCPASEELENFKKSIPNPDMPTVNYEEFSRSFLKNTDALIQLIESKKVYHSNWSVTVEPRALSFSDTP